MIKNLRGYIREMGGHYTDSRDLQLHMFERAFIVAKNRKVAAEVLGKDVRDFKKQWKFCDEWPVDDYCENTIYIFTEKTGWVDPKIITALRWTQKVAPDIKPPHPSSKKLLKGFFPVGAGSYYPGVEIACSTYISHSIGRDDETRSQGAISLYSTRLLALRALRHECEVSAGKLLARIDRQIAEEEKGILEKLNEQVDKKKRSKK